MCVCVCVCVCVSKRPWCRGRKSLVSDWFRAATIVLVFSQMKFVCSLACYFCGLLSLNDRLDYITTKFALQLASRATLFAMPRYVYDVHGGNEWQKILELLVRPADRVYATFILRPIRSNCDKWKHQREKSNTTNRKSTASFAVSLRWSPYVAPKHQSGLKNKKGA